MKPAELLAAAIKKSITRNTAAFQSKFGPKSLDAKLHDDSETTLRDRLILANTCEPFSGDEPLSSLTTAERDQLISEQPRLVFEVARIRRRTASGEGWRSTLDIDLGRMNRVGTQGLGR